MHGTMDFRLHMLFNTSEMGRKGISLERSEEGTEDLCETFVLPRYTHKTNTGSDQIPSLNSTEKRDLWVLTAC